MRIYSSFAVQWLVQKEDAMLFLLVDGFSHRSVSLGSKAAIIFHVYGEECCHMLVSHLSLDGVKNSEKAKLAF